MSHKSEHRSGTDRRRIDKGPPQGWKERRRSVERRFPQVTEISFEEWQAFAGKDSGPKNAEAAPDPTYDWAGVPRRK